uniref:Uncharacterized protein n=1 Tax=Tetraselmis sp. GSL018 TaxID=582737 RepID=A0A061SFB2_9CHLO|mmetsp:Transcript_10854/g.25790  ORF Transcript_10854/g.25790 Transcript_10854/m.25790 type:complete len:318 (+) Transcript_10854:190-1143(+)|eukprot:CAMPEP_0177590188 /NCGR_PEP_ID=MMETSP0419_2-20121207/7248_1 /TAXON_ID=582737 /ORGANISM="Tetraselmis sp., Strain GSL018" /LENGTH=317 /DNA_ID=CAMNT_0019080681 /DNA_START=73 /DNA_END=1026 /DNA_ORIENTATION=-
MTLPEFFRFGNKTTKVFPNNSSRDFHLGSRLQGRWMAELFPGGYVTRPARYPDEREWAEVMKVNPGWSYPVETSSIATFFSSCFETGAQVYDAAHLLFKFMNTKKLRKNLRIVTRGLRLYATMLGVCLAEIQHVVQEADSMGRYVFYGVEAEPNQSNLLQRTLSPAIHSLNAQHIQLIVELQSWISESKQLTTELLTPALRKLDLARQNALNLVRILLCDVSFHIRKNFSQEEIWKIIRGKMPKDRLQDFPNYRGRRFQVLAGLAAEIPTAVRVDRVRSLAPAPFPLPLPLFLLICEYFHRRHVKAPLKLIVKEADR